MLNATRAQDNTEADAPPRRHPRTIGWFSSTSIAMGGIKQSLFLMSAFLIGQEAFPGQGSAAVVLLGVGLLLIGVGKDR